MPLAWRSPVSSRGKELSCDGSRSSIKKAASAKPPPRSTWPRPWPRSGQRVCILDLDPQAHATTHLGIEPDGKAPSMYDVLINSRPLAEVRRKVDDDLWVVGSDINLAAAEVELAGVVGREVILRDLLLQDEGAFDFVFMDCAPSLGVLTLNALSAANEVFIPLQPHFLALHGMGKLLETTALVAKRINPALKVTGIVLCLYESSTRLAQEVIRRFARVPRQEPRHQRPLGQGPHLRDAHPPQHQAGRVPQLRPVDLRVRADLPWRRDYAALAQEVLGEPARRCSPPASKSMTAARPTWSVSNRNWPIRNSPPRARRSPTVIQ